VSKSPLVSLSLSLSLSHHGQDQWSSSTCCSIHLLFPPPPQAAPAHAEEQQSSSQPPSLPDLSEYRGHWEVLDGSICDFCQRKTAGSSIVRESNGKYIPHKNYCRVCYEGEAKALATCTLCAGVWPKVPCTLCGGSVAMCREWHRECAAKRKREEKRSKKTKIKSKKKPKGEEEKLICDCWQCCCFLAASECRHA
jgi:hypothetical protein